MPELLNLLREWLGPNPTLHALTVVGASVIVGKLAQWISCAALGLWARRTKTDLDDRFLKIMRRPIFLTFPLLGVIVGSTLLDISAAAEHVIHASAQTILIVIWMIFANRACKIMLAVLSHFEHRFELVQARTLPLFHNLASVVLFGAAIYFLFLAWDINVSAWLASAGIIGLAVSFAAKDTLANLFAGVFILADAPYRLGDFIVLDSGERGRVTQIGLRSTRLLTRDDIEITVPNAVIGNAKIVNESGGPHEKERVRVKVSVAYGSDIDKIRELLIEVAGRHEEICDEPAPRVRFRLFGDSGLVFELLCWIAEPVLRGRLMDELNSDVYKTFIAEGVEIPYNKQDIYVRELPSGTSLRQP